MANDRLCISNVDVVQKTLVSVCSLAQLMSNKGILFANDANVERAKAIIGNIHRMGIVNCVVSTYDGRKLPKVKQCIVTVSFVVAEWLVNAVMVMQEDADVVVRPAGDDMAMT